LLGGRRVSGIVVVSGGAFTRFGLWMLLEWGRTTHAGIIAACGPVCAEESSTSDTIVNSERRKLDGDIMAALGFSFGRDELIVSKACVYVYTCIVETSQRPTPAPRIPLPFGSPS
jgi:hypothetical protein